MTKTAAVTPALAWDSLSLINSFYWQRLALTNPVLIEARTPVSEVSWVASVTAFPAPLVIPVVMLSLR